MRNKGFIVFLTVVIALLCVYYLSFTFVSRNVQKAATEYATSASGNIDFAKKQTYLDSVWNEPVYSLFGFIDYTYKDIKETELSLGLDLQGGMHVTMEISPVDIIKGLSGNYDDPAFTKALRKANEMQRSSQESYEDLFYKAYKELKPDGQLSEIFANAANQGKISLQSSDSDVLKIIKNEVSQAIDRSFNILRTRIDRFGTSQPNIQRIPGTGRIQIELPGVENQARVRKLLQGVAKLEFWQVVELYDDEIAGPLQIINNKLAEEEKLNGIESLDDGTVTGNADADKSQSQDLATLLQDENNQDTTATGADSLAPATALDSIANTQISQFLSLINYPQGVVNLKDTSKVNRILRRIMTGDLKSLMPGNIKFLWDVKPEVQNGEEIIRLNAIKIGRGGRAQLTGEVITDARQSYDQRTAPAVSMSMNSHGARIWKRMTGENIGKRIAIVLDDYVYSAPNVQSEIPNGQSIITGNFTLEEAQDLANVLKAGALPVRTRIVEEAVIGPTLGKEAQSQGVNSIFAGMLIVVLFMVFYYSKAGLIANAALLFNIFFILGILAQLNAALTLPGIAGIVLTIGMSIDANVLIIERIREELRGGNTLLSAISAGYDKAYSSIIDANVTTFITGVILFVMGQGPVKGFATTLMIGIVSSFFSAVFITRVIITWSTRKGDKSKINFDTKLTRNWLTNLNINFLAKRKIAYLISSSIIVFGMILIFFEGGLNLGVDFTGGRSYVVSFPTPIVASDLKTSLTGSFENAGTEVKTYGANNVVKITTSYLVNDESSEADEKVQSTLIQGVGDFSSLQFVSDDSKVDDSHFTILSSSKVGATIADDIKTASLWSILLAIVAIFLYILMRFRRWQFSLGAIVALLHDTMFVLAAFAIARLFGKSFEIDQVFIAAMLTIIGYSINDTVVVFDRIRENLRVRPHEKLIETFNMSLNQTMSRTIITSMTTLIVVLILLVFGGEVLRGFSFALSIGVIIGTYSSVFIATPVALDLAKVKIKKK